jgi:MFS family permease
MLSVLRRRRNFAVLWLGGLLSLMGDWMLMTALPLVVYQLTGSTVALGAAVLAKALPRVAVGAFAGVFVDRWDRRRTMLIADVLLAVGLLPLLLVHSSSDLWLVVAVLLFESTVVQFYQPAEGALLPSVVPADELVAANTLNGLSMNVARLGGPPLGALLVAVGGLHGVVLADAATFLIAAGTVALVRLATHGPRGQRHALWREWLDGLRTVRIEPVPRVLFAFMAITGVGEGLLSTLFVPFATRVMHGNELTYGALLSAQAVGGLAGGVILGHSGMKISPARLLGWSAVVFGLLDLAIFYSPLLSPSVLVTLGLMALVGIPSAAMLAAAMTLLQTSVGGEQLGRLFGTFFAVASLSGLFGTAIAGALGDVVGIVLLLTLQGLGYVGAGGLVLLALSGTGGTLARRPVSRCR